MDIVAALKAGRLAAQATHTDRIKVYRPGPLVTDPETGVVTPSEVILWEGKGKIQAQGATVNTPVAGGHQFTVESMTLHLPVGAGPVSVGDFATILSAPLNPERVGHKFRITGLMEKTHATAQRLKVERVTA